MLFLISIVLAVLTFGLLEFTAIQFVGGRCYSIPFGGSQCGSQDWPWILSILFWIVFWIILVKACIYFYKRNNKAKIEEENKKDNQGKYDDKG